jgi:hypothetical protein
MRPTAPTGSRLLWSCACAFVPQPLYPHNFSDRALASSIRGTERVLPENIYSFHAVNNIIRLYKSSQSADMYLYVKSKMLNLDSPNSKVEDFIRVNWNLVGGVI